MKQHKISLFSAVLLNINIMIGSGILIGPGRIAAIAGNASFLAWPLVALLFLPLVLCTVQLSRMFPGCGGFYSYATQGINTAAGFVSGWLYVMGYVFCIAVDLLALRQTLLVSVGENWWTGTPLIFNISCLSVFLLFNFMSLRIIERFLNSMTITKMLPLIILVLLLPCIFTANFSVTASEIAAVPLSLPFAIFAFLGFESCCSVSHLIENNERNAPRAILYGFLITAALYTLFHLGVLQLMGAQQLTTFGAPAYAQFLMIPVPFIKDFLMWLIPLTSLLTIAAGSSGLLNSNAIMVQSIAQERVMKLWPWFAAVTEKYQRPWMGLLLQGIIVLSLITFVPNVDVLGSLCNLGVFLSFVLPIISLIILQRRKGAVRAMPISIIALITALGLSFYSWYTLGTTVSERLFYSLPLVAVLVLGLLLYKGRRADAAH